jgi:murein DD-endopeptidase MepM/ murein hydrolase activator NlpD
MLVPDEGGEARSFRLSARGVKGLGVLVAGVLLALAVMGGSWWFLALEASKGWELEALVDSLEEERGRILALAAQLEEVEAGYQHIRSLFGPTADPIAPDLWLPPTGLPGSRNVRENSASEENSPTAWPLTEAGFVTQALIEGGGEEDHPGLDIAVPTDSYVRAAGAGRVLRTGEDPVYGHFVVLEHGNGYQTVYAHNSSILVSRGQGIRRGEVIALSGSTGRSTAPHLHFEILLDGLPVDPLTLVAQPG